MMNDSEKYYEAKSIANALKKKATGNNTDETVIKKWLYKNPYAKNVINQFTEEKHLSDMLNEYQSIKEECTKDTERVIHDVTKRERQKRVQRYKLLSASVAAALIVVSLLLFNVYPDKKETIASTTNTIEAISINKPHLILNDGEKVDITASANTVLEKVIDKESHRLNYSSTQQTAVKEVEYHTLVTPSAYTYSITLADGTEVTLNANSKLRYPVKFTQERREVSLEGEAYFKVKKDAKPFVVNSTGVETKVYGTEFNVQAYGNETVKTVLVSGFVGVRLNDNSQEIMLKSNQMTTVNIHSGIISVTDVDVKRYMAWLTGQFRYDSEKIGEAIDEFSRWYGVEFKFSNLQSRDEIITGLFEKKSNIDSILLTIEKVTTLKFTKKGGFYFIE